MTFTEWQEFARGIDARADAVSNAIRDRARVIAAGIGVDPEMAFHLCHNWMDLPEMAPHRSKMRLVLYMEKKSWAPHDLAAKIISRAWKRVPGMYHG